MSNSRALTAILLTLLVSACRADLTTPELTTSSQPAHPANPDSAVSRAVISASSPLIVIGTPEGLVEDVPTVRVTKLTRSGREPVAGVRVTFTTLEVQADLSAGLVTMREVEAVLGARSAVTDEDGFATVGSWLLPKLSGEYSLIASTADEGSIMFTAIVQPAPAIVIYDLQANPGELFPQTLQGGGSTWEFWGVHYVLCPDGQFFLWYDVRNISGGNYTGPQAPSHGFYLKPDSATIRFYIVPLSYPTWISYSERGGFFATGTLSGDVMRVSYADYDDYDDEVYLARTKANQ